MNNLFCKDSQTKSPFVFWLFAILVVTFFRLSPQLVHHAWAQNSSLFQTDSGVYVLMGQDFAHGGPASKLFTVGGLGRTPVYPLFIAACLRLFGANLFWVVVAQNICLAMTGFFILRLAFFLTKSKTLSVLAFLAWVLDGATFIYANYIYSEPLYVFVSLMSIFLFTRYLDVQKRLWLVLSSFSWAIATLVRPIGEFAPVIFIAVLLLNSAASLKRCIRDAVIYILCFGILVLPFLVANRVFYHQFSLSNQLELTTSELAVSSLAMRLGIPYEEASSRLKGPPRQELLAHPMIYLKLYSKGIGMLLFTTGSRDFCSLVGIHSSYFLTTGRYENPSGSLVQGVWNLVQHGPLSKNTYIAFYGALLLLTYFFALKSLRFLFTRQSPEKFTYILCLLLILYYIIITGALGTTRYRVPLAPLLVLLACVGIRKSSHPEFPEIKVP